MEGNFDCAKIVFFPNLQKICSVEFFFRIIVHFPFQMPKAITKKNQGVTGLIF